MDVGTPFFWEAAGQTCIALLSVGQIFCSLQNRIATVMDSNFLILACPEISLISLSRYIL